MSDPSDTSPATATPADTGGDTRPFGAEVGRLLDLVVHSLYSNR